VRLTQAGACWVYFSVILPFCDFFWRRPLLVGRIILEQAWLTEEGFCDLVSLSHLQLFVLEKKNGFIVCLPRAGFFLTELDHFLCILFLFFVHLFFHPSFWKLYFHFFLDFVKFCWSFLFFLIDDCFLIWYVFPQFLWFFLFSISISMVYFDAFKNHYFGKTDWVLLVRFSFLVFFLFP
jgi:hypothetical protein